MSATRAHVGALDGVRGVAVALVVVHHVVVRDDDPALLGGWLGVDLFFVLSGFLITISVLQQHRELGAFLSRRFWRIAPAMVVLLAVYAASIIGAGDARQRAEWLFAAATQWANVQGAIGPPFSPHIGHLWSLSAEVQFYVLWGVVLWWLLRRGTSRAVVFGVLAVLFVLGAAERALLWEGGTPWNRLYLGPDTHSGSLLAGCMTAVALDAGWLRARRTIALLTIPGALLVAWAVVELTFLDGRAYQWVLTTFAIAAAVIVASGAIRAPSPLRPVLELAPLQFLGRISYSLYLWHLPVIAEVARRHDSIVTIAVLAIPLSLLLGTVSYAVVERPFLTSANRARLRARFAG